MLCYAILCYDMLCYAMLSYVMHASFYTRHFCISVFWVMVDHIVHDSIPDLFSEHLFSLSCTVCIGYAIVRRVILVLLQQCQVHAEANSAKGQTSTWRLKCYP